MRLLPLLLLTISLVSVSAKVFFEDRFLNGKIDKWTISEAESEKLGKCEFAKPDPVLDEKEDGGMNTTEEARFYRYSAPFESSFSNKDKNMCVQFSVKYPSDAECAGGYIKLFGKDFKPEEFDGETPYEIMFGPDVCGYSTRLVHLIFSYKGKNHLIQEPIPFIVNNITHLFTLILRPDNTFEVKVDQESRRNGSLSDDFDMLKPKMIDDPNSKKPDDWVDAEVIRDPEDRKPDDWDQPETIEDTNATKPEDWNDESDGEWTPPRIPNPNFKGEWFPKTIPNPAYKGEWKPAQISNPEFVDDPNLYSRVFAHIGIDLWQVKSGTLFDNFIVSDDLNECETHAQYWKSRHDAEMAINESADVQGEDESSQGYFETSSNFNELAKESAETEETEDSADKASSLEAGEETKKPHEEL